MATLEVQDAREQRMRQQLLARMEAVSRKLDNILGNKEATPTVDAHRVFDERLGHLEANNSHMLRVTVSHVFYPVTEEVLHQVFDAFGAEKVYVHGRVAGVEALILFRSCRDAVRAREALHDRCIYDNCCWLDIQYEMSHPTIIIPVTPAKCSTPCPNHSAGMPTVASTSATVVSPPLAIPLVVEPVGVTPSVQVKVEQAVAGLDLQASVAANDLHISSEPDPRVHPSSSTISHPLRVNHLNCHENKEGGMGTENFETSGLESSSGKDVRIRENFNNEVGDAERTSRGGIGPIGRDVVEPTPDNVDTDTVCIAEVDGSISESDLHSSLMTSQRTMPGLEDGEIALHRTSSTAVLSGERSDISQSSLTPVLPATSTTSSIIGESIPDAIPTRADVPVFSGPLGPIDGSTLHDDVMSIFSNDGPGRSRDSSNSETRRNHRRVLWDAFSRRGSRGYLDSDTDDRGFYSRWVDLGDDLFGDEVEEARYFHRRRHGSIRVSQYSRSRIREHRRAVFDSGNEQSIVACPLGIHQIGRCTCDSFLIAEEHSARASISRIVMLTEALFEVLDEIHRQPASLSLSMASVHAPESVVNSLPCKSYKKLDAAQCTDDMEQCHICLTEYEDGDQIRSLPCKHEFHLQCVDKWLKEIHRVCPLCRGDVCEGAS